MLHLLQCSQLLFTRLSLPDSELWLQWGGTVLGILWSCGYMSMPLCAFIPWIRNISFCRVAGRAISAQAPGISILHPYSCWVFPLPLQMEMSGRDSCTDLMITTTQPLCAWKRQQVQSGWREYTFLVVLLLFFHHNLYWLVEKLFWLVCKLFMLGCKLSPPKCWKTVWPLSWWVAWPPRSLLLEKEAWEKCTL